MTDEAYALVETPGFSLGRVLEDSFETLARTAPQLLGIVLIVSVPLFVWLVMGGEPLLLQFAATAGGEGALKHFDPAALMLGGLIGLISLAIHAAVTDAAFQDLLGEEGDLLQSLARALVVAPSLIAVALFVTLLFGGAAFLIGLAGALLAGVIHWSFGVALFVGGLIGLLAVMTRLWLLVPAIVVESANPIDCFRRSTQLTEGYQLKIFTLLLIVYVPQILVNAVLILAMPLLGPLVVAILNIVLSGAFITFNTVVTVTIYGHLRAIKEGSTATGLADVFD